MKIRHHLLLLLTGAGLVATVALAVFGSGIIARASRESAEARLSFESDLLALQVATLGADPKARHVWVQSVGGKLGLRLTLITEDGRVVADSALRDDSELPSLENHLARPEVIEAGKEGRGRSLRRSTSVGQEFLYLARRLEGAGEVRFLRLALPTRELDRFEPGHLIALVASVLVSLAASTALAYWAVRRLSRPIEAMSRSAELVAAGELGVSVPDHPDEELSRLAFAINRMKGTLVTKLEELDDEHQLVLTMMEGMEEGLLLVGKDHQVLMANAAVRRIFRVHVDPIGHRLGEVVRHPTVIREVDRTIANGESRRETVTGTPGSDKSFDLHLRMVDIPRGGGERGVLVLFIDITRLEALEKVRRQFVADVGHELRTPVTSIKGALETVLEGGLVENSDGRHFLAVAARQADRMAELLSDLTDLSLIETGSIQLDLEAVELAALVEDVLAGLQSRAKDREVQLRAEVALSTLVRADRRRLEQILTNLVDNGIKFNRPGGSVTVRAPTVGPVVHIEVVDTGVGIPPDSLNRVFQRFYRVEKSRSRDAGGTGLGLAIAKHLVRLHEGEIRVESEVGVGSRFTVELLKASPEGPGD